MKQILLILLKIVLAAIVMFGFYYVLSNYKAYLNDTPEFVRLHPDGPWSRHSKYEFKMNTFMTAVLLLAALFGIFIRSYIGTIVMIILAYLVYFKA